jgi:hypothetical protein
VEDGITFQGVYTLRLLVRRQPPSAKRCICRQEIMRTFLMYLGSRLVSIMLSIMSTTASRNRWVADTHDWNLPRGLQPGGANSTTDREPSAALPPDEANRSSNNNFVFASDR